MRILWISYTPGGTRYLDVLKQTLLSLVTPGTEIDVVGMKKPNLHLHRLSEWRCAHDVVAEHHNASQRGYDAVVVGHFQDGGVHELRSILDIPVVGLGEAAMHHAMQLGDSFGLVTINPGFLAYHRQQVRTYQLTDKFAGVRAMTTDAPTYQDAFNGDESKVDLLADEFRRAAMELVEQGADVIIPAGGFPALLLWTYERVPDLGESTVLDPLGIAIGQAEMWARLGNRVRPGRSGAFARASEAVVQEIADSLARSASAHPAL